MSKKIFKAAVKIAAGYISNAVYFGRTIELADSAEQVGNAIAKASVDLAKKIEKESNDDIKKN